MNDILASAITTAVITPVGDRERLAARIFRFAVAVNLALTIYSLVSAFTGFGNSIAGQYLFNSQAVGRVRPRRRGGRCLSRRDGRAAGTVHPAQDGPAV